MSDHDVIVTAGGMRREAAVRRRRRRKDPNRRKRFVQEVWYLRRGSNVAFSPQHGVTGDDVVPVTLNPKARILHITNDALAAGSRRTAQLAGPDAELIAAVREQAEAIKNLSCMFQQLMAMNTGGYDAIKTEDRLILLNSKALADAPQRKRWL